VAPTVLVCDDAQGFRLMLASYLESAALEVSICATWEEAVECAGCQQPDAVVLDLWMPTFKPELLRVIRDVSPRSAVVIVSAHPVEVSRESIAGIDGITAVVSKRDHPDVIVDAVSQALANATRALPRAGR
jgi:DNA-binding NtrC family response regulator